MARTHENVLYKAIKRKRNPLDPRANQPRLGHTHAGAATPRMKLKQLVGELQGVQTWRHPKSELEQYPTPPDIAAHMLLALMLARV